jgi:hypothetical protein
MSSSTRSRRPDVSPSALAAALVAAAAFSAEPARAQAPRASPMTAAPMTQPPFITRYVSDGRLAGEGKLTWLGFHVYDARLYASPRFDIAAPFTQPFVLELTYARKLEGKAIAEASRDEIQRLGLGDEAQQRRWLAEMEKIFPNVDKGSRIAGVFQPDTGARFYVDGVFAGSVDEPAFSRAFFAIWLDPRTRAPRLRESLLKPAAGPSAGLAP